MTLKDLVQALQTNQYNPKAIDNIYCFDNLYEKRTLFQYLGKEAHYLKLMDLTLIRHLELMATLSPKRKIQQQEIFRLNLHEMCHAITHYHPFWLTEQTEHPRRIKSSDATKLVDKLLANPKAYLSFLSHPDLIFGQVGEQDLITMLKFYVMHRELRERIVNFQSIIELKDLFEYLLNSSSCNNDTFLMMSAEMEISRGYLQENPMPNRALFYLFGRSIHFDIHRDPKDLSTNDKIYLIQMYLFVYRFADADLQIKIAEKVEALLEILDEQATQKIATLFIPPYGLLSKSESWTSPCILSRLSVLSNEKLGRAVDELYLRINRIIGKPPHDGEHIWDLYPSRALMLYLSQGNFPRVSRVMIPLSSTEPQLSFDDLALLAASEKVAFKPVITDDVDPSTTLADFLRIIKRILSFSNYPVRASIELRGIERLCPPEIITKLLEQLEENKPEHCALSVVQNKQIQEPTQAPVLIQANFIAPANNSYEALNENEELKRFDPVI